MGADVRFGTLHRGLALAAVLAATTGCGPDVLQVSSFEALETSLAKLREPMLPVELDRFEEALGYLVGDAALAEVNNALLSEIDVAPVRQQLVLARFRLLDGRTAEGVVAEARFRRIREVRSAVILLETWRDATKEARIALGEFRFTTARVFKRHKQFLEWPVIEIRVENGTGQQLSLVHFRAALLKPDEEEPWLVEEFDHVVLGGLPAGAHDTWRIEPEQQEWIRLIDPHPELNFSLEVMRLLGPGGRVIAATDWGGIEAHQLEIYQRTLHRIRTSGRLALDSPPLPTADWRQGTQTPATSDPHIQVAEGETSDDAVESTTEAIARGK